MVDSNYLLFHILCRQNKNLNDPMLYSHVPYPFLNVISLRNSEAWEACFRGQDS